MVVLEGFCYVFYVNSSNSYADGTDLSVRGCAMSKLMANMFGGIYVPRVLGSFLCYLRRMLSHCIRWVALARVATWICHFLNVCWQIADFETRFHLFTQCTSSLKTAQLPTPQYEFGCYSFEDWTCVHPINFGLIDVYCRNCTFATSLFFHFHLLVCFLSVGLFSFVWKTCKGNNRIENELIIEINYTVLINHISDWMKYMVQFMHIFQLFTLIVDLSNRYTIPLYSLMYICTIRHHVPLLLGCPFMYSIKPLSWNSTSITVINTINVFIAYQHLWSTQLVCCAYHTQLNAQG